MKAPTKRELYERVESLQMQVVLLQRQISGIGDHLVAYTITEPVQVGHTIMIRVPRNFGGVSFVDDTI